jgi:integrase
VLRSALAQAVRLGIIPTNPCTDIDLPRANRQEMLFLNANQVAALAEAIDPQYRVLICTAAYTGLRAGELGGLLTSDVDLLRGVLHVNKHSRTSTASSNSAPPRRTPTGRSACRASSALSRTSTWRRIPALPAATYSR